MGPGLSYSEIKHFRGHSCYQDSWAHFWEASLWRPGQVGGDGGQSAAEAGARSHRSQGSPALAGPLIRRLVPRSTSLTAAGLGSLAVSRAEGRVRGKVVVVVVAGKRPPGREKRRSHGRGPLGDGYDLRAPRPPRSRPSSPAPS